MGRVVCTKHPSQLYGEQSDVDHWNWSITFEKTSSSRKGACSCVRIKETICIEVGYNVSVPRKQLSSKLVNDLCDSLRYQNILNPALICILQQIEQSLSLGGCSHEKSAILTGKGTFAMVGTLLTATEVDELVLWRDQMVKFKYCGLSLSSPKSCDVVVSSRPNHC